MSAPIALRLIPARLAYALACALLAAGCNTLPRLDTPGLEPGADENRPARFVSATRVLSEAQSKAIVERLKRQAGDTDILSRHIAISEAISGSPMVTGNQAIRSSGPATYAAMFAARATPRKHYMVTYNLRDGGRSRQAIRRLLSEKRHRASRVT